MILSFNPDYFEQQSERLVYRRLTPEDAESWESFFENNDSLRFLALENSGKDNRTLASEWVARQLERNRTEGLGHLAVIEKESGTLIGMGGIIPRNLEDREEFEISYSLKPAFHGKGYGTELARQMKRFGTESGISSSFISIIHQENKPSMRVAEKNGMHILYPGTFLGMDVYIFGDRS